MIQQNYEVEVLVNGKPLKEYDHNHRIHIEGREKTRFSLRLRNNSATRKLFVPTIDGLSVMDGKDADFDSSGYVIGPYSSYTVNGWRVSDGEVAEFYFSHPKDSYRKKIKKGNNLGIIGVAVFDEKKRPIKEIVVEKYLIPQYPQWWGNGFYYAASGSYTITTSGTSDAAYDSLSALQSNTSCSMNASNASSNQMYSMSSTQGIQQDLGTGWGDYKKSEVTTVEFERASNPTAVFEIYYNTREQLEKIGIDFNKTPVYVTPSAFPGQYCKPPRD